MKRSLVYTAIFILCLLTIISAKNFEDINWLTDMEQAKAVAKETNTNILVLFTKTTCPACVNLKKTFAGDISDKFEASVQDKFTIVHLKDGASAGPGEWTVDGGYIPRVYFASADGTPLIKLTHPDRAQYKYFYHDVDTLIVGINNAEKKITAGDY